MEERLCNTSRAKVLKEALFKATKERLRTESLSFGNAKEFTLRNLGFLKGLKSDATFKAALSNALDAEEENAAHCLVASSLYASFERYVYRSEEISGERKIPSCVKKLKVVCDVTDHLLAMPTRLYEEEYVDEWDAPEESVEIGCLVGMSSAVDRAIGRHATKLVESDLPGQISAEDLPGDTSMLAPLGHCMRHRQPNCSVCRRMAKVIRQRFMGTAESLKVPANWRTTSLRQSRAPYAAKTTDAPHLPPQGITNTTRNGQGLQGRRTLVIWPVPEDEAGDDVPSSTIQAQNLAVGDVSWSASDAPAEQAFLATSSQTRSESDLSVKNDGAPSDSLPGLTKSTTQDVDMGDAESEESEEEPQRVVVQSVVRGRNVPLLRLIPRFLRLTSYVLKDGMQLTPQWYSLFLELLIQSVLDGYLVQNWVTFDPGEAVMSIGSDIPAPGKARPAFIDDPRQVAAVVGASLADVRAKNNLSLPAPWGSDESDDEDEEPPLSAGENDSQLATRMWARFVSKQYASHNACAARIFKSTPAHAQFVHDARLARMRFFGSYDEPLLEQMARINKEHPRLDFEARMIHFIHAVCGRLERPISDANLSVYVA